MSKISKNFIKEIMLGTTLGILTATLMISFNYSPDIPNTQQVEPAYTPITITIPEVQQILQGKVVRVIDGDTIVILTESNREITIRLKSIDCPERNQPFGKKAKDFVLDQVAGKEVTIINTSLDRYRRTIGFVLYESKNLSKELLKQGLAWHYTKYSSDQELQQLEDRARLNNLGLWSNKASIAPWEFRKLKRGY